MRPIPRAALGIAAAALVASAATLLVATLRDSRPPLPVLGELGEVELTDEHGQRFTGADLRGRVTIANFIFTRCPTVCPTATLKVKRLITETEDGGDRVRAVSFSVDPEHDTPERLLAFAREQGADNPRWSFVTGPAEELRSRVEDALKVALERRGILADGTPDIVHGPHFVLLDGALRIRGYYNSNDAERLRDLAEDALRLADDL